ncbi:hypothetical protein D9611_010584 [Ephemerocybe angulata]|uniref:3'-5' exonuclease domain-containing protein n=1 Tax=Ephemerocybe angulata TaxID=980116 RepID=A0A8H5BVB7_9AGAR|nr:hypothetical protein D9611_010584 [Tulosesus angulatus]
MANAQSNIQLADTLDKVSACVTDLSTPPTGTEAPCISADLEGVQLSRKGRVSLVQLKASHSSITWLLDITVLGAAAFSHPNDEGLTVKILLESPAYKKIFYDVRRDADALYNIYGIEMQNVVDVQLVELAVRMSNGQSTKFLHGLAKSITFYLFPGPEWARVKDAGVALFVPEKGGSVEAFELRPLHPALMAYAAQDVALLSRLEVRLVARMGRSGRGVETWDQRIKRASEGRLEEAKSSYYEPDGRHRALSPLI